MKCEVAQQNVALLVYGELPDDARHQLENHIAGCEACVHELEGVQALQRAMAMLPVEEPSPNLLTRARMQLEEALDSMPNRGWISAFTQLLITGVGRLQAAPAVASTVLILGLAAGGFAGYRVGQKTASAAQPQTVAHDRSTHDTAQDPDVAQVADVSSIVQTPNTEQVEVHYDRVVPEVMKGSLDDENVRQLLELGARSRLDNGIRDNSVDLLAHECQAGHQCDDGPMRRVLLSALSNDKNASVRLKALAGLQPYVGEDVKVRDAVLKAITSDRDPEVRIQAISMLTPVEGDSSVRGVLHTVATDDANPHIRTVSQQVLDQLPETQ
jgi:hypothetical protein